MKKKMNKNLTVGLWLTGIMLTLILVGFFWTPYNPETMDNAAKLSGVSFSHLMGCDNFGRDIFSRVLKGGGTTFCVALGTVAIGTVFGVIIGAFTGYFGGILDEVLMLHQRCAVCISKHPAGACVRNPSWRRHMERDYCAGHCIYPELCENCPRRVYPL